MTTQKKTAKKRSPAGAAARPSAAEKTARRLSAALVRLLRDALWLMLLVAALWLVLSLLSFAMDDPAWSRSTAAQNARNLGGLAGAYTADILYYLSGRSCWWIVFAVFLWLFKGLRHITSPMPSAGAAAQEGYAAGWGVLGLLLLLAVSPVVEFTLWQQSLAQKLPVGAGGLSGNALAPVLTRWLGVFGSLIAALALMLCGLSLLVQVSWLDLAEWFGRQGERLWLKMTGKTPRTAPVPKRVSRRMIAKAKAVTQQPLAQEESAQSPRKKNTAVTINPPFQASLPFDEETAAANRAAVCTLPPADLLNPPHRYTTQADPSLLQTNAELIETKLAEFGIEVKVVSATPGPVITRYEIEPAQGVKGSQIVALAKDLARALSLDSVRVVETISGRSTMGIELPNSERQEVALSEIVAAPVFQNAASKLTLALGKDIAGAPVVADLDKMPHLLVAGATGSGKSVGINTMILSLLLRATPEEVRLILIDPKMVEMSMYKDIAHLLAPVVTDMAQAPAALNWCVHEMEKRFRLFGHLQTKDLAGCNAKIQAAEEQETPLPDPFSPDPDAPLPLQKMPYIVVVIDELADLMMVEGKKIEALITRITQKARAAGIRMILATQRPSADVITGLIKANIPTRLAFQVAGKIDSRIILDQMGAEHLLGKGDMLFLPPGAAQPVRLHGAYVSEEEVLKVTAFLKRQSPPDYVEGLLTGEAEARTAAELGLGGQERSELFDRAVQFVLESRKTSISSLQRHLRIGYNKAATLMEEMENAGVVSPPEIGGSRKILVHNHEN